jgi:hypothetical protein
MKLGPNKTVEDNAPPAMSAMAIGFIGRSFPFRGGRFRRVPHLLRSVKCMKRYLSSCLYLGILLVTGCVTADFKVVDALRPGMSQAEAQRTIASFGFQRGEALTRSESGWPTELQSNSGLAKRAAYEENRLQEKISAAEFYPVHHGMLGYGELFLFYGVDGKLRSYYRHQIN